MDEKNRENDGRKPDRRELLETSTKVIGAMSVFSIAVFQSIGNAADESENRPPPDVNAADVAKTRLRTDGHSPSAAGPGASILRLPGGKQA